MIKWIFTMILALTIVHAAGPRAFCAAQPSGAQIDLSKGLSFEKYITTGDSSRMASALERMSSITLSEPLLAFVREIDTPIVLAAYTDITCPDCARTIPFVQAISNANPFVSAVYFLRDDETRPFMRTQTGKSSIPTIFVTDRSGSVAGDVYVEYPEFVQALIDASASNEEAARHRDDLRSGRYDGEIERDLRKLIDSALAELRNR
jgi:hypothetical protein